MPVEPSRAGAGAVAVPDVDANWGPGVFVCVLKLDLHKLNGTHRFLIRPVRGQSETESTLSRSRSGVRRLRPRLMRFYGV